MGSGRFDPSDWGSYSTSRGYDKADTKTEDIFSSSSMSAELDPKGLAFRESRDSADNPQSTPIIVGIDVTGSMGMIADVLARKGVPTLCENIYTKKPVSDPQILCAGIGDAECDRSPLQVTQFESDIRISQQLEKIWLEKGGGGNHYEGYALMWWFAAMHTKTDSFEKRGKKGYLFTIGDEYPTPHLRKQDLHRVFGDTLQGSDISMQELLTMASRQWEIFHIVVAEGSCCRHFGVEDVHAKWSDVVGQRAVILRDHTKLAEVMVSVIQANEGHSHEDITKAWDGTTSLVVQEAIKSLSPTSAKSGGVVSL